MLTITHHLSKIPTFQLSISSNSLGSTSRVSLFKRACTLRCKLATIYKERTTRSLYHIKICGAILGQTLAVWGNHLHDSTSKKRDFARFGSLSQYMQKMPGFLAIFQKVPICAICQYFLKICVADLGQTLLNVHLNSLNPQAQSFGSKQRSILFPSAPSALLNMCAILDMLSTQSANNLCRNCFNSL